MLKFFIAMKLVFHKFKRRENRRYNYTPRYYKGKEGAQTFDFETSTFHKYRDMPNAADFGAHWKVDRAESRNRKNREINGRILFIAFILIFIFLWIIDFDLSIFTLPFDRK